MALLTPIFVAIICLAIGGGRLIDGAIQLAGAGNAAAAAASADLRTGSGSIEADAAAAADREEGLTCPSPSTPGCVTVTTSTRTGGHGTSLEVLVLSQRVTSFLPMVPTLGISLTVVVGR